MRFVVVLILRRAISMARFSASVGLPLTIFTAECFRAFEVAKLPAYFSGRVDLA